MVVRHRVRGVAGGRRDAEPELLGATASAVNFLWTTFTRFEPARDIYGARQNVVAHHVALSPPIVIDARTKPWYPKELFADDATKKKVNDRWREYFPGKEVEMGDSERGHLD